MITQRETDFSVEAVPGTEQMALRIPAHIFCYLIGQSERLSAGDVEEGGR